MTDGLHGVSIHQKRARRNAAQLEFIGDLQVQRQTVSLVYISPQTRLHGRTPQEVVAQIVSEALAPVEA